MTRRINYANVVATLALILAMTGGATAASKQVVIAAKKIGGRQITSNSITTSKVKNYSLRAVDFAPCQIPASNTVNPICDVLRDSCTANSITCKTAIDDH